jgi:hypothetical protein
MKLNLPTWLAVVLTFATLGGYSLLLLGNKLDGLFPIVIYFISIGVSWLMTGFTYGVLPGVKAYRATLKQMQITKAVEPDAPTARDIAIGYWKWFGCMIILPLLITIGYHFQLAGYW